MQELDNKLTGLDQEPLDLRALFQMHDAARVRMVERVGDLARNADRLLERYRAQLDET